MTDESMDEFAQWQHDESLTVPDAEVPTEADIESFEILCLTDCLNGNHSLRFEIVSGRLTTLCEDGCMMVETDEIVADEIDWRHPFPAALEYGSDE